MSESPAGPTPAVLRADVPTAPSLQRAFMSSCTVSGGSPGQRRESSPPAEHPWVETSPKSSLALLGNGWPAGSLLGSREFPGPGQDGSGWPHFPPADLQTPFHGHQLALMDPPEALGPPSGQAFLSFCSAPGGAGLPPGGDAGALLASSHEASPALGPPRAAVEPADDGFLSHGFLTVVPGHSSHHSPVLQGPGMTLPGQPPLPEKKWASEGDRSFGSASPSSSSFSSPHSGRTMSIPFPNVLPEFSRASEVATPSPDNPGEKQVTELCPRHIQVLVQGRYLQRASHRHAEGQGARGLHRQGQPLLPGCLRAGHEGGHDPALRPAAEQESWRFGQRTGPVFLDRVHPKGSAVERMPQRAVFWEPDSLGVPAFHHAPGSALQTAHSRQSRSVGGNSRKLSPDRGQLRDGAAEAGGSLQRVVPELRGDGVPHRTPGHSEGPEHHPGPGAAPLVHGRALQGVGPGHHADGQPEEVPVQGGRGGRGRCHFCKCKHLSSRF